MIFFRIHPDLFSEMRKVGLVRSHTGVSFCARQKENPSAGRYTYLKLMIIVSAAKSGLRVMIT